MMTTDRRTQTDQKRTIEKLLKDEQVLVHINPTYPGVVIPNYLADNRTVTLRLSRFFKGNLITDEEQITAELLFGPEYFVCVIPWNSVWGASSIRGEEFVWTECTPPEILHLVIEQDRRNAQFEDKENSERKARVAASHLRRVK